MLQISGKTFGHHFWHNCPNLSVSEICTYFCTHNLKNYHDKCSYKDYTRQTLLPVNVVVIFTLKHLDFAKIQVIFCIKLLF